MPVKLCRFAILIIFVFSYSSCSNYIGLGSKVNTGVPVINLPDDPDGISAPGSYLEGRENIIFFDAFQNASGFEINSLYLTLEYKDKNGVKKT